MSAYGLQSFTSTETFHSCDECSEPDGQDGVSYTGFGLFNTAGNFKYRGVIDVEECKELCSLAGGCNFIDYNKSSKECSLRYGVGERSREQRSRDAIFFGPKKFTSNNSNNTGKTPI
jgi:hypothetical protein